MSAVDDAAPGVPAAASPAEGPRYLDEENIALTAAIGRPRTVLDVGCGSGVNGAAARRKGARVTGIESFPPAIERARRVLDEVLVLDATDPEAVSRALAHTTFDLLLFGDVLEHTPDPAAVLRSFLPYLEDEGHVLVSLPNVAAWTVRLSLLRGDFEYQQSGILDETHLRFFTLRSAAALVEAAGLEVLRVEHNPMLVRAAKDVLAPLFLGSERQTTALADSSAYRAYQRFVRPLEEALVRQRPGLLAFQHVIVARKRPRPRPLSLTVGMLTMDEEDSVAGMMEAIRRVAPDAKILCVDSSSDKTPEIAASGGARVLRQVPARGHAPALELLMYEAASESDLLIYLDCDFTYPAEQIPVVRKMVEDEAVDVVNCARTRDKPASMPLPNWIANRTFAAMAHGLHGVPTCDVHSGMRAYRSSVTRAFDFYGGGDALPVDTLLLPARCGYRVVEAPIEYSERVGTSKLKKLEGTLWTLIRLGSSLRTGRRGAHRYDVR